MRTKEYIPLSRSGKVKDVCSTPSAAPGSSTHARVGPNCVRCTSLYSARLFGRRNGHNELSLLVEFLYGIDSTSRKCNTDGRSDELNGTRYLFASGRHIGVSCDERAQFRRSRHANGNFSRDLVFGSWQHDFGSRPFGKSSPPQRESRVAARWTFRYAARGKRDRR
jgi:hypothetical protein